MRFNLIHGAWHGAWCWDAVIPELNRLGHQAVAIDLPGHGKKAHQQSTLEGYTSAVTLTIQPDDVLVGHSMGAIVATLAANVMPAQVKHVIYLAGILPIEGRSMADATSAPGVLGSPDNGADKSALPIDLPFTLDSGGATASFLDFQKAWSYLYADCSPDMARRAFELLTPQALAPLRVPLAVPRFWAAQLPRSYIMCSQDAAVAPDFARGMAERLGVVPLKIETSHSPFLSRPQELAELLVTAERTRPTGPLRPC